MPVPVVSHQFRYSMLCRVPEQDILPYGRQQNIATLAYMSLEQGLLTGKIGMDREFAQDEFRSNEDWNPWFKLENRKRILEQLDSRESLTCWSGPEMRSKRLKMPRQPTSSSAQPIGTE